MKEIVFYLCGIFTCMIVWFLWAVIASKKAKEAPLKEYARIHIDIEKAIRENEEQIAAAKRYQLLEDHTIDQMILQWKIEYLQSQREWLFTLNDGGTKLPSHPDRLKTPGVDMTTGSLGQGTSAAAGIATGFKMNKTDQYVYLIVGDGELNEGQCWEAFQYIAHYKLNHCVVIIDDNKKQLDGTTKEVMNPFSIENKMKAFGFYTQTVKGNDEEAIDEAINRAKNVKDQAVCIILDSIKGAGVPYFEQLDANHSVKFNNDTIKKATKDAIKELDEFIKGGAR